jgi:2-methylcitrate dehydratase PrpD
MNTISEKLAAFTANLRYEDLPPEVIEHVCFHTLDIIGVCLLCAQMDFANILRSTVIHSGGAAESTLIGCGGLKLQAPVATLFNGGLAHGNEFDDTYAPGRWHGSAPTVPPALAIAEMLHADGKAFITALAAGLEVGCRLTRAAPEILYQGFHSTCTAGIFAGALSAGKLMALDVEQLANAMGICGSFTSGTMEFLSDPEPWSKRIQVGYAGHGAIIAARAASNGFKGPRTILEGRYGYFRSHAREGNFDLSYVTEAMGSDWQVLHLYPKRYPCDHIAQGYIDCAIALSSAEGITPETIDRVECIVHPLVVPVMFEPRDIRYQPTNGWSARWSMPFNIAVALADRALTIDSYTDERAHDQATRALMAKVTYIKEASLEFPGDYPAWVRLHVRDGRVLEHKVPQVAGSPENPMPAEEYEKKFMDNACRSTEAGRAREIVNCIRKLPSLPDMADLAVLYA